MGLKPGRVDIVFFLYIRCSKENIARKSVSILKVAMSLQPAMYGISTTAESNHMPNVVWLCEPMNMCLIGVYCIPERLLIVPLKKRHHIVESRLAVTFFINDF